MNTSDLRRLARVLDRYPWLADDFIDTRERDADGHLLYRQGDQCPNCKGLHNHGTDWTGTRSHHCGARAWAGMDELRKLGRADLAERLYLGIEPTYTLAPR